MGRDDCPRSASPVASNPRERACAPECRAASIRAIARNAAFAAPSYPFLQHSRGLGDLEIAYPTPQQWIQVCDKVGQRLTAPKALQFAGARWFRRRRLSTAIRTRLSRCAVKPNPEELPFPGPRDRTFRRVDLQVQDLLEKDPDPTPSPVHQRVVTRT